MKLDASEARSLPSLRHQKNTERERERERAKYKEMKI